MSLQFRLVLILVGLAVPLTGLAADPPARQRVLLLGQKPDSHPASTHEYMAGVRLLAGFLEKTPAVQTIVAQADSPWEDGPELLDGADAAIVFLSEGARWVTEDAKRLEAFQRLARRGGGLTCLHWGMGARDAAPVADFTALFGACHGGADRKYKFSTFAAKPTDHVIATGIAPFEVRDEFYYALKLPSAESKTKTLPVLRIAVDGADEMVSWATERPDGGRSFGFSGLHYHDNWKRPEYRRLVLQGVLWTLKREIPTGGISITDE